MIIWLENGKFKINLFRHKLGKSSGYLLAETPVFHLFLLS